MSGSAARARAIAARHRPPAGTPPSAAAGPLGSDLPSAQSPVEPDANALPADLIEVGRIVDAWGILGWVKIEAFNAPEESVLTRVRRCWLPDGRVVLLDKTRVHGGHLVARPRGSEDRDAALRYKGLALRVSRADFPPSPEGEFYWVDLPGCGVRNREGFEFGEVLAVDDFGAHPVLRVGGGTHPTRLIPFVETWIVSVDLAARVILVDWQPDY